MRAIITTSAVINVKPGEAARRAGAAQSQKVTPHKRPHPLPLQTYEDQHSSEEEEEEEEESEDGEEEDDITSAESESSEDEEGGEPEDQQGASRQQQLEWDDSTLTY